MEKLIVEQLIKNPDFFQTCFAYLKKEYFKDNTPERVLFDNIRIYANAYDKVPTCKELLIITKNRKNLTESLYKQTTDLIKDIFESKESPDKKWLLENTEEFCKKTEFYNCILEVIQTLDQDKAWMNVDLDKFQNALSITFSPAIGHKYINEADKRWDDLHSLKNKFTTGIKSLDKALEGGVEPKTLNLFMAVSNAGKTMIMIHGARENYFAGKKVLYLSAEVSEFRIGDRFDANILDMKMSDVKKLTREKYLELLDKKRPKNANGEIIIKEYPTSSATAMHIRGLLNELKLKEGFVPDIIYLDYLNIFASHKFQNSKNLNLYTSVKATAEEFRALAQEWNVPIISATQSNRSAVDKTTNVDIDAISESFGVLATADFMCAIVRTEELDQANQILLKQLKSRYGDVAIAKHIFVNVDRQKQKFYDIDGENNDRMMYLQETSNIANKIDKEFEQAKKQENDSRPAISFDDFDDQ